MNRYFFHYSRLPQVKQLLTNSKIEYKEVPISEYKTKRYSLYEFPDAVSSEDIKTIVNNAGLRHSDNYSVPEVDINIEDHELTETIMHAHGFFAKVK